MAQNKNTKKEEGINLVDLFFYLLSYWYWFVLGVLICGGFAAYRYATSTLVYRADATIIIKDPSNTTSTARLDSYNNLINRTSVSNEILQFKSKNLMTKVVERLEANINYKVDARLRTNEVYTASPVKVIFLNKQVQGVQNISVTPIDENNVMINQVSTVALNDTISTDVGQVVVIPTSHYDSSWYNREVKVSRVPAASAASAFLSRLMIRQPNDDASILSFSLQDNNRERAKDVLNVRFEVGKDCEKVRVAMMPGKASNDDLQKILNGSVAYQDITKTQDVAFDYPADGVYTFYAIPYLNGVNRRVTYLTKELNYQNLGWRKLGFATYTEAFLADMEGQLIQGIEPVTYSVEIEESTETPGYFRLIDPYGDNYPYSTKNDYDNTRHYYMEIDASDPECVMIKEMSDGCGYNFGVGKMVMWSRADRELNTRGKSKEEVKEMGYFGKCENGVITFPDEMLLISFPDFYPFPYYANVSGKFRLVLPEGAGVGRIEATQTEGNEEIFDLNGRRVQRSAMTPGMYILRQNGKTTKVLY